MNQKVIKRHVEKWGLRCDVASNGADAVRLVTQDRPPNYYCLVLMDLFMPNVDGFEATKLIREWEHLRDNEDAEGKKSPTVVRLPIVVLTANVVGGILIVFKLFSRK